jgi:hypothetical protein
MRGKLKTKEETKRVKFSQIKKDGFGSVCVY